MPGAVATVAKAIPVVNTLVGIGEGITKAISGSDQRDEDANLRREISLPDRARVALTGDQQSVASELASQFGLGGQVPGAPITPQSAGVQTRQSLSQLRQRINQLGQSRGFGVPPAGQV